MSAVNFNDYANYENYNMGYDFSALMGGTANSSSNLLSDYASIKNGSYGKPIMQNRMQKTHLCRGTAGRN